ncbi:hypothetical protein FRC18_008081 [Serendipita sp. 400]|nr:hypothetical protein FRC18_008081 [Serendipita sp. 400]
MEPGQKALISVERRRLHVDSTLLLPYPREQRASYYSSWFPSPCRRSQSRETVVFVVKRMDPHGPPALFRAAITFAEDAWIRY